MNREYLLQIIDNVLNDKLSITEFYNLWKSDNSLENVIFEDIENCLVHLPANPLTKKVDYLHWRTSDDYLILYTDSLLLNTNLNFDEITRIRSIIIHKILNNCCKIKDIDKIVKSLNSDR